MLDVPELGTRVRVWPMPGRRVQLNEWPVDHRGGGRFMRSSGEEVEWSIYHMQLLKSGALLLHPPPCEKHDFGDDGKADACALCGRDMKAAQTYDVHRAKGITLAKLARSEALSDAEKSLVADELKALEDAAKAEAAKSAPAPAAPAPKE